MVYRAQCPAGATAPGARSSVLGARSSVPGARSSVPGAARGIVWARANEQTSCPVLPYRTRRDDS